MEIVVEVHQGEDGRPTGTVRRAGETEARRFSGNLEFLALVERLYLTESGTVRSKVPHEAELTDDNSDRRE